MARKMLVLGAALLPVAGVAAVLLPRDGDALGRLVTAKLPGETVSYAYNVRNALTSITSPRFSQQLRYAAGASAPCYNGNIAEAVTQGNRYAYTYDNANRLTSAKYTPSAGDADYSATYAYDRNSNITALTRKGLKDVFGNYGPVDDLTMLYDGNRLWRVSDHADEVLLENSGNLRNPEIFDPSETQFGYDANGNTVKDLSRNIEKMDYNPINLPLSARLVQGTDRLTGRKTNQSISYTYDASGIRHRVIHATQPLLGTRPMRIATADTTDYVGNYVIRNGQIDKILTPYGYMQDGVHHTFLHDYQGNVAAVVVGDSVAQRNSYYPYGLPHVTGLIKLQSPSATSVTDNPYKYGGKKYDTFGGTDLYDFHARYHAPSTGRFMTVDPMAEKYPGISPYIYCAGNPIAYIDPDGMDIIVNICGIDYFFREIEKGRYGLIDSEGNEYDGDSETAKAVLFALNTLRQGNVGRFIVDSFIKSNQQLEILPLYKQYHEGNYFKVISLAIPKKDKETIGWVVDGTFGGPSVDAEGNISEVRPAYIGLGHELAHAWDYIFGTWNESTWFGYNNGVIDYTDVFACHIENLIRAEHSLPLRTHYQKGCSVSKVIWGGNISTYYNTPYINNFIFRK